VATHAEPGVEAAVVSVDVLDVVGAPDPNAGAQIDRLMGVSSVARKVTIGRISVTHQQRIRIKNGRQNRLELSLGDLPLAGDEIEGLSRAIAGDENADLLVGEAALGCSAATFARLASQSAAAFVRLEEISFVRFGNALQMHRTVVLRPREEAMAPTKSCVSVHAEHRGRFAHRQRIEHRLAVSQPFLPFAQPRQRRAGQGTERLLATSAPITLQPAREAVPIQTLRPTVGATPAPAHAGFNQRAASRPVIALCKQRFHLFALPPGQRPQPLDPPFKFMSFHDAPRSASFSVVRARRHGRVPQRTVT